jgi:hypothetical protein
MGLTHQEESCGLVQAHGGRLQRQNSHARRLAVLLTALLMLMNLPRGADGQTVLPDAPQASPSGSETISTDGPTALQTGLQKPRPPKPDPTAGQVHGMVVDQDGDVVDDATVVLTREGSTETVKTQTRLDGRYQFGLVSPGSFRVTASAMGLSPGSYAGILASNESFEVPAITLRVAKAEAQVQVVASQEELAEAEIKVEEHQRLGGIFPNFFVTYDWHAPPLTVRQKFALSTKNAFDPGSFFVSGIVAGIQQANGTFDNGYGQGVEGFARRYGAASADLISGTYLGGAILPTLFHQDPRYFYKGTGSVRSRALYAITRAFISKGDNGKWQPAYASILGDLSAGAISNIYYPAASRSGAALTFEEGLLNIGGDAIGYLAQEFIEKHLTTHVPNYTNP